MKVRLKILSGCAACGLLLGLAVSFLLPPSFRSTALLRWVPPVGSPPGGGFNLQAVRIRLQGSPFLDEVFAEVGAPWTLQRLRRAVGARAASKDLLELSVDARKPQAAQSALRSLLDRFLQRDAQPAPRAARTDGRLAGYRETMEDIRSKIDALQREHPLLLPSKKKGGRGLSEVERYAQVQNEVVDLDIRVQALEEKRRSLREQLEKEPKEIVINRVRELNPAVERLQQELVEKEVELNKLRVDSSENHPLVRRLRGEVENLQRVLRRQSSQSVREETLAVNPVYQEAKLELSKTGRLIGELRVKKAELEKREKKMGADTERVAGVRAEIESMEREYALNRDLYVSLRTRLESMASERQRKADEAPASFEVVEAPSLPERARRPGRLLFSLLGLVGGLAAGLIGTGLSSRRPPAWMENGGA